MHQTEPMRTDFGPGLLPLLRFSAAFFRDGKRFRCDADRIQLTDTVR
jgi:hypothetical protein